MIVVIDVVGVGVIIHVIVIVYVIVGSMMSCFRYMMVIVLI